MSSKYCVDWARGDFVESEHPRWPRGTPDQAGEFRDKDGSADESTKDPAAAMALQAAINKDILYKIRRRAARKEARAILIAGLRAVAGVAADIVPVAGEAFDAYEIEQTVADFKELYVEADAATAYVQGGPKLLDSLRVSMQDEGFPSSNAFAKDFLDKRFGPAGDGYDYHHIVEQTGPNGDNIPAELLHSTENMIRMPRLLHEAITSAYYDEAPAAPEMNLRTWLRTQPYEVQRAEGIRVMRELHIIK